MNITLDGLVAGGHFDGRAPVVAGVQYVLSDLTGWWGSPSLRTKRTNRPGAAGSYRSPAYRDVRSIGIKVTATSLAFSNLAMRQVERRLTALCSDPDQLYLLTVVDEAGPLAAYVELDGDIDPRPRDGLGYSTVFDIAVAATDPRRLAPAWTSVTTPASVVGVGGVVASGGGAVSTAPGLVAGTAPVVAGVTVVGMGTAKRLPLVLEVDGPATDVLVVDAAGTSVVAYRGNLGVGDTVWINCDNQDARDVPGAPGPIAAHGAVLSGGGNARAAVSVAGGWPRLVAGKTATYVLAGGATTGAALTVHTREAYE